MAARPIRSRRAGGQALDLRLRPTRGEGDLDGMLAAYNEGSRADGVDERISRAWLAHWLEHATPGFDPAQDVVVAEVGRRVVGYGWSFWMDSTDGVRAYVTRGHVHPAWRRKGVGTAMLAYNEARLRRLADSHDTDRPRELGSFVQDSRLGAVALLTGSGYAPVRWFFEMVRPTLEDIGVPELPAGIEFRAASGRDGLRKVFDADAEAFRDHWGGVDASDEAFEEWVSDPELVPELLVVAWDGDEVAGGVKNVISEEENAELGRARGLLDSVFVRRRWRGRGLGAALVARSLQLLRDRGMTSAWLGVDADNPNGALRLYERAGFAVAGRGTAYRKPMELSK